MAIKFRKNALKFLETADSEIKEKIREQLKQVMICVENQGFIPFNELDIKKMKGNWEGFYRLRIGKIRIVFTVSSAAREVEVYTIGFRGDIYKS